ncbi:phosphotriesterase family protein [Roseomonas marmotae]|uniref:Phosphotriesterase-related protein n=1 Tax=Roseomonas marmotae TaxID=2768161 RepID=A0ABS3KHI6_9PROT|nr:hypothetical protein [Roseomonas marmotae]MBO1076936.1 phosphotriesterase-related protein [Roseomonas marmotae]QTI82073.1 phosphotriesterase-related protein [Roseomonas marmotae]
MPYVETIHGRVDSNDLGLTLMHEHIFTQNKEMQENYPNPEWDEAQLIAVARDGLRRLRTLGIGTLVDLTCFGLGRDVPLLQRVCEGIDIHVVVATGFYFFNELPKYFHLHGPGMRVDIPDPIPAMMIRDIQNGIAETGVRAGIIKIGSDSPGMTPDVQRIFKAAVRAQQETGVTISTHSNAKMKGGLDQVALLKDSGADLSRVIIGHCGDTTDLDYLKALLDSGVQIGMDRFGLNSFLSTELRIDTIVKLCGLGYAGQMTLSQDAGFWSCTTEPSVRARVNPEWTHFLICEFVLPELSRRGVPQEHIDTMMLHNPSRLLGRS